MSCDAAVHELDWREALDAGHVLILGEMHGTTEIPAFAATAVCHALRSGRHVGLFVEWPVALQGRLADPTALLADPFFTGSFQDGRRSAAMVGLVATAQRWRAGGAPVEVVAMDPVESPRDVGMAGAIRAWLGVNPEGVAVALAGNIHARVVQGWRNKPEYQPMGLLLADLGDRLESLNARYAGGSAWNCQSDGCGVHPLGGTDLGEAPKIEWSATRDAYDGWFYVGTATPSAPAVEGYERAPAAQGAAPDAPASPGTIPAPGPSRAPP